MADNYLETTRTVNFEKAVEFQLAEIGTDFEAMCDFKGGITGEKTEITDRFGNLRGKKKTSRFAKKDLQDNVVERRWIHKQESISCHTALDMDDQMATEIPLDSPLAEGVARGIQISRQDEFLIGFYTDAATGKEGTQYVPFSSANIIAADFESPGTATGLSLPKMKTVRKRARQLLIDPRVEKLHWMITAEQIEDLLDIDEYVRREYNPDSQIMQGVYGRPLSEGARQALQDGMPTDFLGFHFVPKEFTNSKMYPEANELGLTTDANGNELCPVWVPKGMAGREWLTVLTKRSQRTDLDGDPWQFSAYTNIRYGRRDEKRCFQVACKPT
tara:strand:- start:229 stop:1218 length:990 start_codon:yes stop_codon:yes gene_type:complete